MLKSQHQKILQIVPILDKKGKLTVGRLKTEMTKVMGVEINYYDLKSACELLENFDIVDIEKTSDNRTHISLTDTGTSLAKIIEE